MDAANFDRYMTFKAINGLEAKFSWPDIRDASIEEQHDLPFLGRIFNRRLRYYRKIKDREKKQDAEIKAAMKEAMGH